MTRPHRSIRILSFDMLPRRPADAQARVYTQCGLRLRSSVELDLPLSTTASCDVDIQWEVGEAQTSDPPAGEPIALCERSGEWWYKAVTNDDGYRIRFRECGDFHVSADLDRVRVERDPDGRYAHLLPVLMAGTVSSFLLSLRGRTVLHASAVSIDGSVLAFIGQSGRGKTTLAALLCRAGAQLVTDDVLTVGAPPPSCRGGATTLRLREAAGELAAIDTATTASLTVDGRVAFTPVAAPHTDLPLRAVVIPSPTRTASEVVVHRLRPDIALLALSTFPRVQGWSSADVLRRDFATLAAIADVVSVYHVSVPWGPPFAPGVVPRLTSLVSS